MMDANTETRAELLKRLRALVAGSGGDRLFPCIEDGLCREDPVRDIAQFGIGYTPQHEIERPVHLSERNPLRVRPRIKPVSGPAARLEPLDAPSATIQPGTPS
jgi:hypothetical protein